MQTLIDKGHAYAAQDGSGDVYFDVRSYPAYGELAHGIRAGSSGLAPGVLGDGPQVPR